MPASSTTRKTQKNPESSQKPRAVRKAGKPVAQAVAGAKRSAPGKRLTAAQVLTYLKAHPEFFEAHANNLTEMVLPSKAGNVLSLHAHKAQRVDKKAENLKVRYTQLVDAARQNALVTESIHAAVLGALACGTAAEFRKFLQNRNETGFMGLLELDACHLATGVTADEMALLCATGLALGPAEPALHRPLFGAHIVDMKSVCLMRVGTDALLALGSSEATRFHAGQGTDLVQFLRNVLALYWGHIQGV